MKYLYIIYFLSTLTLFCQEPPKNVKNEIFFLSICSKGFFAKSTFSGKVTFKTGTDIFFGNINNTPDSLIAYYNSATLSTSFQTNLVNIHKNFLFENILDKSRLSYA